MPETLPRTRPARLLLRGAAVLAPLALFVAAGAETICNRLAARSVFD